MHTVQRRRYGIQGHLSHSQGSQNYFMQMSLDSAPPYFNYLVLILIPSSAIEDVIQVSVVSQALRRGVSCTTMARPPTI